MYPHSLLWHYLWIAPHALQGVIAVMMIRRRIFREFPVFFAYTVYEMFQCATLFILDHSSAISAYQYWYAYWAGMMGSIALRFAIIREILSHVFRPYPGFAELGRVVFHWTAVVLLIVAIAVVAHAPGDDKYAILSGLQVVGCTVGIIQSGLLLFLVLLSSYFGLSWRNYVYGIAAGLGIFSTVDLATAAIRVWTGPDAAVNYIFNFVTMATYHCCVLIWLVYLLAPESVRRTVKALPEDNLEQWNTELQRLLLQ